MRERNEFVELINTFKTVSPSITDIQRRGLLKQAVQNYGLSVEEASEILKSLGLVVGEAIDYFEVLGLSIEEIQGSDEQTIVSIVEAAHEQHYKASLRAGARIRPDGKTEEQWRNILNQARETLIDTQKRREYLATFLLQDDLPEVVPNDLPQSDDEFEDPESTPENEIEDVSSADSVSVAPSVDVPNDMVFIPAGRFQMGSQGKDEDSSGITTHTVYLGPFFMDKYPVTNAQYQVFLDSNPQWQKKKIPDNYHDGNYLQTWSSNNYPRGKADHPVVDVSWYAAMAYAQWSGKRLPTEAEWEKAARGGLIGKIYPWGDHIDIDMANYGMHIRRTTPVGKYPPNDYGVYDAVGNVWEWCLDEYNDSPSHRNPGLAAKNVSETTTNFLSIASTRILRGGSWASSERAARVNYCGCADPIITYYSYGFRCVKDITP
ncbi:MAG: formylglycine-generating enzyme family protein [Candidatus Poribacteria bacterium]|nr:formylglycine-generating enzyme family protein [Candidatus Poribacteria bacterium]